MCTRHFTQLELARRWAISPRTLERWRWTGQGPSFLKLNGRVAYRLGDIEAFEAERLSSSARSRWSGLSGAGRQLGRIVELWTLALAKAPRSRRR